MKTRLFSYGGSGLKFLTNYLNEYTEVYDTAHYPHSIPCEENSDVDRIIYPYADPRNVLLSCFRRNKDRVAQRNELRIRRSVLEYLLRTGNFVDEDEERRLKKEFKKNQFRENLIKVGGWAGDYFHYLGLSPEIEIKHDIEIEEFLEQYRDTTVIQDHFLAWLHSGHPNIIFVKYEYPVSVMGKVMDFLGLDRSLLEGFDEKYRSRESDYRKESAVLRQMLNDYFKELLEIQQALPPFYKLKGIKIQ